MHHRHCWIYSLLKNNTKPVICLLGTYDNKQAIEQAEILQIEHCKKLGVKLVNSTAGGDGLREYKFTKERLDQVRFKVDQYTKDGLLLNTYESLSAAAEIVTGDSKNNSKISSVTRGLYGRRSAFGYIWRVHGDIFDKYPITSQINITDAQRKATSKRQLESNVMKDKKGLLNSTSKPILIVKDNIILDITESVREVTIILKLSRSCVSNMLRMNKEVNSYRLFYANKDIVQSLQKCKSSTLKTFVGQKYLEVG